MLIENGQFIMQGKSMDDPERIKNPEELIALVDRVGFLPLFANTVPGFSVEDMSYPGYWWSGDPERDPWEWRIAASAAESLVYGKFFERKAGFISRKWFPVFANYRRDGYDFDARWDDGLASRRQKKIMDEMPDGETRFSYEIKELAGFGKGGEKNFEGTITDLQMQGYLIVRDFRQKKRKKDGKGYGWHISVYSTPEAKWGREEIAAAYREEPADSFARILDFLKSLYPEAEEKQLKQIMKGLRA